MCCACVFAMSGSSGRQPGILFLNFGSCCTAPHIMAPLLKVGIVFCYQFSKENKAIQASATKRTGSKFSPEDFHSHNKKNNKKTQEITKNIKPSLSSQLHAAVFLQAVEYCASPSNCCGFRDFSRFLFLEICWSSASFPQLRARPLRGSVLTGFIMNKTTGFIMKWRVETGVSPHLKAEPAMDLPGLRS